MLATFNYPADIVVDAKVILYVADQANHRIRKVIRDNNGNVQVSTIAGSTKGNVNGPVATAQF